WPTSPKPQSGWAGCSEIEPNCVYDESCRLLVDSKTLMTSQQQQVPRGTGHAEPAKRFSISLPASLHTRFKTVCNATNRRMASEIANLVEDRTAELEEAAGLWRSRDSSAAHRLEVIEQALTCNHPTGDIEEMLADIERGRDLH
ncbi:MAG: hypothetical protein OXF68_11750, partial [Gammaproteobacteria bacterium]|nr:hypothetical protein [Gammaproteobacteria bacterium]